VFDSVSTGASDDLKRASELAINMVGSLGFSEAFGLLSVAGVPKELLGPDIQAAVLREARLLLERAQATCQRLLRSNRTQLDALAQCLLEREVISGPELKDLLGERIGDSGECDAAYARVLIEHFPDPAPLDGLCRTTMGSKIDRTASI
jgi:ATP-dependent Zn protease